MQTKRRSVIFLAVIVLFLLGLIASAMHFGQHFMLISICFVVLALIPFFVRFELKSMQAREIVLIAVLAGIAAVCRVPFSALPSVQPTTFVIIVSALVFGAETGFFIGVTAALVSNMFLGQGLWTPWQMFSWGMVGLSAGLLKDVWWMNRKWGKAIFGIAWGFLFGWTMNITAVIQLIQDQAWQEIIPYYGASLYFDLAHALSNAILLVLLGDKWCKLLGRIKSKYGILSA